MADSLNPSQLIIDRINVGEKEYKISLPSENIGNGLKLDTSDYILQINANSGLTVDENGVSIKVGKGLKIDESNVIDLKLSTGILNDDKNGIYIPFSDGLEFTGDAVKVKLGNGLSFDSNKAIMVDYAFGGSPSDLQGAITAVNNRIDALVDDSSATDAIDTFNEIKNFLADVDNSENFIDIVNSKLDNNKVYLWTWNGNATTNSQNDENINPNAFENIKNADIILVKNTATNTINIAENKKLLNSNQVNFSYSNFNYIDNTITEYDFEYSNGYYNVYINTNTVATSSDLENLVTSDELSNAYDYADEVVETLSSFTNSQLSTLSTNITNEASARENADNELRGLISSNTSAITALQNKKPTVNNTTLML